MADKTRAAVQLVGGLVRQGVDLDYAQLLAERHADRLEREDPDEVAEELLRAVPEKFRRESEPDDRQARRESESEGGGSNFYERLRTKVRAEQEAKAETAERRREAHRRFGHG